MPDPIPLDKLRWSCDVESLPFDSTADLEPILGVIGQSSAVEALRFGLECNAPGQNIFVRGLTGTGRMTLIGRLLEELKPVCEIKKDHCYVHNFSDVDHPRLLSLPIGKARAFRRRMQAFAEFIRDGLVEVLKSEAVDARRKSVERREKARIDAVTVPFEKALREASLALVTLQQGPVTQTTIFPVINNKTLPPEELEAMHVDGGIDETEYQDLKAKIELHRESLDDCTEKIRAIRQECAAAIQTLVEETVRMVVGEFLVGITKEFPAAESYLKEVVDDVVDNRLQAAEEFDPKLVYGVNILIEHTDDGHCPIVIENTPTPGNLLGCVERDWGAAGPILSDYRMIRAGSLLRADGGYLILDARDLIEEPGAWKALVRTLRSSQVEITPANTGWPMAQASLKPEPIPVSVRVILLGDSATYYLLDDADPDFSHLFKVLADFDDSIPHEPDGVLLYAGVLTRIIREEGLPHMHRSAVAAIAEHGARIAESQHRLTTRFARVADIAREAAYLCKKRAATVVQGEDIREAVRRTKSRADLPSRRFQDLLRAGTILIQTQGKVIGQINGLAIMSAGPLTYGFPARITASIGAGNAGIINIEGRADLSGSIHTKGFHILGGLLRHLLQADHPLAFSASLTFEQSYGGIDGDSASCAEICCLLSAMTGVAIDQSWAITGAIDQFGHIQAIGGVNEKIEGFFDACKALSPTGRHGVIIPASNAEKLMLRQDVVTACAENKFRVVAVATVHEALAILTGTEVMPRDEDGRYPEGSLLALAVCRAEEFWRKSLRSPFAEAEDEEEEEEQEAEAETE